MRVPIAPFFALCLTLAACSRLGGASDRATSEPHVESAKADATGTRMERTGTEAAEGASSNAPSAEVASANSRVVVELFSSEGCSSCPPADEVLRDLAQEPGVLALEMHVDYWNDLGWADPFSSRAFTDRQRAYASHLARSGVYTPQAVIDGQDELVGSDARKLRALVAEARKKPHAEVRLLREGETLTFETPARKDGARVVLVTRESGLATRVPRGENAGKTLVHGPIARSLEPLDPKSETRDGKDTWVAHVPKSKRPSTDYVALLVLPSMRIVGAESVR
jgi:hypothetical protein